jgi:hypothetical protein
MAFMHDVSTLAKYIILEKNVNTNLSNGIHEKRIEMKLQQVQ